MHRRLIRLARQARLPLAATIVSGLMAGLCSLAQAYALSATVDLAFLRHWSVERLSGWLQLLFIMVTVRGFLVWFYEVNANEVAIRVKCDLRQRLFARLLRLGPAFSRAEHTGELTTTAVEGIEALDAYFSQYLPQLLISILVPVSIVLVAFHVDALSGLILLLTAPLVPLFMYLIGRSAETATRRQYETLGRLSSHFLDSLQGLTTLKLFGQAQAQAKNVGRVCDQYRDATLKVLQVSFLSAFALELITTLSTAIIAVEVGLRLLYADMQFRDALFLLILAPEFYMPLRLLGMRFHAGQAGTAAAGRIFAIVDGPVAGDTPIGNGSARGAEPHPSGGGKVSAAEPSTSHPAIEFSDVSYTYPERSSEALAHIDLSIAAGQHVALVGPSGAGKSTLVSLLLGFIRPSSGVIRIHGAPLNAPASEVGRPQIAWVPQTPHLFHETVSANIRLGDPKCTPAAMRQAASEAHIADCIEALPQTYETVIGEGGARLSSGEAQRLALARAFLLDAPVLILDEPSSALDPENESWLEQSVVALTRGRTLITIAHRLNTVRRADLILVLDEGRIVERGSHAELMGLNGKYADLVRASRGAWIEDGSAGESIRQVQQTERMPALQPQPSSLPARLRGDLQSERVDATTARVKPAAILRRLLGFLNGSWNWVALSVLAASLTVGSSVALMGTSAWLISAAALGPAIAELEIAIVGVRFFGIARAVFRYLERLISHGVTFRLLRNIRVWFYEKLEPLAPARLIDYRSGDLLSRAISDVEILENAYVRVISPSLAALCVGLGCAAFFALSNALPAAVILAGFFVLLGLVLPEMLRGLSRRVGAEMVALRGFLHTQLVDGIQGLADILAFRRAGDRLDAIGASGSAYASAERRMARVGALGSGLTVLMVNAAACLVLVVLIPKSWAGALSGTLLAPIALMALASFEAVIPLAQGARLWPATREAARRLFEVVDAEPELDDVVTARIGRERATVQVTPSPWSFPDVELELRAVSFTYPGQANAALRDISFRLPTGGSVGIVGPSGAGKSTLAHLLLRFWDYNSGEIRLSGRCVKTLPADAVRGAMGFVSSHTYFFDTSVRENLRLARPGVTEREIEQAAQRAQLHELISNLPRGYDTLVGERGLQFSAGERQRLAIARVLIKDAPILILDEPTANLDTQTERQVLSTILRALHTKSIILISHRLVGMELLDEILFLCHGAIAERGTHAELLAQGGLYCRMWEVQNGPVA